MSPHQWYCSRSTASTSPSRSSNSDGETCGRGLARSCVEDFEDEARAPSFVLTGLRPKLPGEQREQSKKCCARARLHLSASFDSCTILSRISVLAILGTVSIAESRLLCNGLRTAFRLNARRGFLVTNLALPSRSLVLFYNKRSTAEQWIKEGQQATHWTRLSWPSLPSQRSTASAQHAGLQPAEPKKKAAKRRKKPSKESGGTCHLTVSTT